MFHPASAHIAAQQAYRAACRRSAAHGPDDRSAPDTRAATPEADVAQDDSTAASSPGHRLTAVLALAAVAAMGWIAFAGTGAFDGAEADVVTAVSSPMAADAAAGAMLAAELIGER